VGPTVATDVLSLLHVPPVSARPSDAVAVICSVAPKSTLVFAEVTAIVKLVGVGAVVVLLPHAAATITSRTTQPRLNIGISAPRMD
jgi:hypothetical protein